MNKIYSQLKIKNLKLMAKAYFSFFEFYTRLKPGAINRLIIIGFSR